VSDVARYRKVRQIEGVSSIVWRQGIKHDCAEVMELGEENGHWRMALVSRSTSNTTASFLWRKAPI